MPMTYRARSAAPPINLGLLGAVYLVAGGIIAATHHYYTQLHTARQIGSAALAIVLWPLLYLGINLHIR
jgi:hypothetical protein